MLDFTVSVVRSYRRALELATLSQVKSPGKPTPRQWLVYEKLIRDYSWNQQIRERKGRVGRGRSKAVMQLQWRPWGPLKMG